MVIAVNVSARPVLLGAALDMAPGTGFDVPLTAARGQGHRRSTRRTRGVLSAI